MYLMFIVQGARQADKGEKAKGDVGPITMQSLVASDLEPVEEDIRTSASSPDLKPVNKSNYKNLILNFLRFKTNIYATATVLYKGCRCAGRY